MKSKIVYTSVMLLSLILSGCNEEVPKKPPIKIEKIVRDESFGSFPIKIPQVIITAVSDVTVEDVIINEGNGCPLSTSIPDIPKTMKYGDSIVRTYTNVCTLLKVDVVTNKGTWSVEY